MDNLLRKTLLTGLANRDSRRIYEYARHLSDLIQAGKYGPDRENVDGPSEGTCEGRREELEPAP